MERTWAIRGSKPVSKRCFLALIFCFIPFTAQIIWTVKVYTDVETKVDLLLDKSVQELPGITIALVLDQNLVSPIFQNNVDYQQSFATKVNQIGFELLNVCTFKIGDLIRTPWQMCGHYTNVTIRLIGQELYFTFFENPRSDIDFTFSGKIETFMKIGTFPLVSRSLDTLFIHNQPFGSFYRLSEKSKSFQANITDRVYGLEVDKIIYPDSGRVRNCLNYRQTGHKWTSRSKCLDSCLETKSDPICLSEDSIIKMDMLLTKGVSFGRTNESCVHSVDIRRECKSVCPPDCVEYSIVLNLELKNSLGNYTLEFRIRTHCELSVVPKMDLMALILYIAGAIGLWFGVNIPDLTHFWNKLTKKYNVRVSTKPLLRPSNECHQCYFTLELSNLSWKMVVQFLCLVAFAIQTSMVIREYNEHKTVVNIDFKYKQVDHLPAVTLSFDIGMVTNYSKLLVDSNHPCFNLSANACRLVLRFGEDILYSHIFAALIEPENILVGCQILKLNLEPENCTMSLRPIVRIMSDRVYFTYFAQDSLQEGRVLLHSANDRPALSLAIGPNLVKSTESLVYSLVMILLHQPKVVPDVNFVRHHFVVYSSTVYKLRTTSKVYQLLEYPYSTNCHFYDKTRFGSHIGCYHECYISRSIQLCNSIPNVTMVSKPYWMQRVSSGRSCIRFYRIHENCLKRCNQRDCKQIYWGLNGMTSTENPNGSNLIVELFKPMFDITTIYEYKPQTMLTEVLIYIWGSVSMWLSVSVLSVCRSLFQPRPKLRWQHWSGHHLRHSQARTIIKPTKTRGLLSKVTLIHLLILIPWLFQSTIVVQLYFKRRYFVSLSLDFDHHSENLPSVTVGSKFDNLSQVIANHSSKSMTEQIYQKETLFVDFDLEKCTILSRLSGQKRSACLNVQTRIHSDIIFTTIPLFGLNLTKDNPSERYYLRPLLELKYKRMTDGGGQMKDRFVSLHHGTIVPQETEMEFYQIKSSISKLRISYETSSIRRLPKPYKSNCRDYRSEQLGSRQACYHECMEKKQCLKGERKLSPFVRFTQSELVWLCKKQGKASVLKEDYRDKVDCSEKCNSEDCYMLHYFLKKVSESQSSQEEEAESAWLNLSLIAPDYQITFNYVFVVKFTLLDCLLYLGNVIGFYYGLNVLSALKLIF